MPRIRRSNLPPALLDHLLDRIRDREVSASQLRLLAEWMDTDPVVPEGKWYREFPEIFVCGDGALVKTILRRGQLPEGEEIE